jgi:hypothetical protein
MIDGIKVRYRRETAVLQRYACLSTVGTVP